PAGGTRAEIAATLREIGNTPLTGWSASQREHCEAALEAAWRVVEASSPAEALDAIDAVPLNLNKCKKNTAASELLKRLRDQLKAATYGLITELRAGQRDFLIEILRRFDAAYRERKRQGAVLDFSD